MNLNEALDLADRLIHTKTGKYLNDLERQVFIGSWEGRVYEEIYPFNPQYIEKDVGYKLWKKLSQALGEKVTKKTFKGALERALKSSNAGLEHREKIFISYRRQEPDLGLATQLYEAIQAAGYLVYMANTTSDRLNELHHINAELKQCNYFILLLSPQVAVSEMVIEELRQVKELRARLEGKPTVLPIRVNCPPETPLNHELRGYLEGIELREWTSEADTSTILKEVLDRISGRKDWEKRKEEREELTPPNLASLLPTPLPVAEPELPNGQVRLASAFYVERVPYETQCYKEILQPGALIRIKAPRQMGKTSLMARILYQAQEQGYRTVPLSFQHADTEVFANLNELLRWFCVRIARKLRLPHQIDDYWTDTFGGKDNCTMYFEDYLLSEIDSPLVLGLDEVDRVFQYPQIADDFFSLLRAWYEEGGYGGSDSYCWEKLRLVVVHSTEVYIPLNVNQSPFNVGLPIELPDFSSEQVEDLTERYGLSWNPAEIKQLMALVGGHPYLVRLALYCISQGQTTLSTLLETAPTEAGIYDDHLRRHLWNLQQYPELAAAFRKVVMEDTAIELESLPAFKLHSMGLVQMQGNNVTPRFDLYRQYFRDRLASS